MGGPAGVTDSDLALEGRIGKGTTDPSTFDEEDPTEFGDAEWADAEDVEEQNSSLASSTSFAFSEAAGWLEPTLYVAGAEHEAPDEGEDDWLKRG